MSIPLAKDTLFDRELSVRGRLFKNHPLSDLTWFRLGGLAEMLFQPADEEDLAEFLASLPNECPVLPIGLGSNLLVRDGGISGAVVRPSGRSFGEIIREGESRMRVGAAVPDRLIAEEASKLGIGGFAYFSGIPGCIGGAIRMNAGAHGSETKDRLVEVSMIERNGSLTTLSNSEMGFSYRSSAVSDDVIFTSALLEGNPENPESIRSEMEDVKRHRENSQPIRELTSGSTFKNPEGQSAWKLIEKAGCRGLELGGAKVSEMHCNFLINKGNASATEMEKLGETVRARVLADSGIRLEWEIKRVGKWPEGIEIQEFKEYCS